MKILVSLMFLLSGCNYNTASRDEQRAVERQQEQYGVSQPVPAFNWSLERHLVSELYKLRNRKVSTHAVWRSDYGVIEGDCVSMGFGIPYDTSLTNPLMIRTNSYGMATVEQAEPNGIFASKNTAATWVMCLGAAGAVEPVYVESKVTIYPWPIVVDYKTNRVKRSEGKAITIGSGSNQ